VLPFTGLSYPGGVAVDTAGDVYATDRGHKRVLELAANATGPIVLPFNGLKEPDGVTVDAKGTVYVADKAAQRVWALAAGANVAAEIPIRTTRGGSPGGPFGVALDSAGDLFVTDASNGGVYKVSRGADTAGVLPFTNATQPRGVAAAGGDLYVTDTSTCSSSRRERMLRPCCPSATSPSRAPLRSTAVAPFTSPTSRPVGY
jgi:serine/threonine-protein kinase